MIGSLCCRGINVENISGKTELSIMIESAKVLGLLSKVEKRDWELVFRNGGDVRRIRANEL